MRKKVIKTVSIIALIIFMILFLRTGRARTDVILKDFELSSDGKSIILKVGTSSSTGYIRKMKETLRKNEFGEWIKVIEKNN